MGKLGNPQRQAARQAARGVGVFLADREMWLYCTATSQRDGIVDGPTKPEEVMALLFRGRKRK